MTAAESQILRNNYLEAQGISLQGERMRRGVLAEAVRALPEGVFLTPAEAISHFTDLTGRGPLCRDFALFCRLLSEMGKAGVTDDEGSEEAEEAPYRVSAVRGEGSVKALGDLYAGGGPAVSYSSSAVDVCEDVVEGRSSFCLLPVYSSAEGPLLYFRKLTRRYGLKSVASCTVTLADGNWLQYSLMNRGPLSFSEENNRMEIMVSATHFREGSSFVEVSDEFHARIVRVTVVPAESAGADDSCLLTLNTRNCRRADLDGFRLYLSAVFPDMEIIGSYDLKSAEAVES